MTATPERQTFSCEDTLDSSPGKVAALVWCVRRPLLRVSARKSWRRHRAKQARWRSFRAETCELSQFSTEHFWNIMKYDTVIRADNPFADAELCWALVTQTTTVCWVHYNVARGPSCSTQMRSVAVDIHRGACGAAHTRAAVVDVCIVGRGVNTKDAIDRRVVNALRRCRQV